MVLCVEEMLSVACPTGTEDGLGVFYLTHPEFACESSWGSREANLQLW